MPELSGCIRLDDHPVQQPAYRDRCRAELDRSGALVLDGFLTRKARATILDEAEARRPEAYFTVDEHTSYLDPPDPTFAADHARNRLVASSKGCLTDDQIPTGSPLRTIYDSDVFRSFLRAVLGVEELHPYADPLSSINVHLHDDGQELGWHFDNSSFAVTMLIQAPREGGRFDYIPGLRVSEQGDMSFDDVGRALGGRLGHLSLAMRPGCLVLFRGRDALHRVTPSRGDRTRVLAVLAYNTEPGVELSQAARLTFFGRLA